MNIPIRWSHLSSSDKIAAVDVVTSKLFLFIADAVFLPSWLPHTTLRVPPNPSEAHMHMDEKQHVLL